MHRLRSSDRIPGVPRPLSVQRIPSFLCPPSPPPPAFTQPSEGGWFDNEGLDHNIDNGHPSFSVVPDSSGRYRPPTPPPKESRLRAIVLAPEGPEQKGISVLVSGVKELGKEGPGEELEIWDTWVEKHVRILETREQILPFAKYRFLNVFKIEEQVVKPSLLPAGKKRHELRIGDFYGECIANISLPDGVNVDSKRKKIECERKDGMKRDEVILKVGY